MRERGSGSNPSDGSSRDDVWTAIALVAATGVLGFGVLFVSTPIAQENGVERQYQLIFVLLVGLLGVLCFLSSGRRPPPGWITRLVFLLPCYVALQIVPLPLAVIRILSPSRVELVESLTAVMDVPRYASLSVVPSTTFRHLLLVIAYVLAFSISADMMPRLHDRRWLAIYPVIIVSLAEAVLGLSQAFEGSSDSYAHGTYLIKNHFVGLLEMALPFVIMYSSAGFVKRKNILGCASAAVAAILLLGIVLSFSRMGIVSTVLSCVMIGVLRVTRVLRGWQRALAIGAVCSAGLAGFVLFPPVEFIERFSSGDVGRVAVWRDTLRLIRAYPIFGCGLGGYESAFMRYKASLPEFNQDYAHNDYLQGLAELGVAGFAIIAAFTVIALNSALRSRKEENLYLGLACAGAILAILIHSTADFNLYIPANAAVFAWILGISSAL